MTKTQKKATSPWGARGEEPSPTKTALLDAALIALERADKAIMEENADEALEELKHAVYYLEEAGLEDEAEVTRKIIEFIEVAREMNLAVEKIRKGVSENEGNPIQFG